MFKIIVCVLVALLAFTISATELSHPMSFEAVGAPHSNHSLRSFQSCAACTSGYQCCCGYANGQPVCMTQSVNPPVYLCFNPNQFQCCPYVPNYGYAMLACERPSHCAPDSTQPSGNACVNSASTLFLSTIAVVAASFVLLL